ERGRAPGPGRAAASPGGGPARAGDRPRGGGAGRRRARPRPGGVAPRRGGGALAAAALGHALVLCPTAAQASAVADRLARAGVTAARHPRGWAQGAAGAAVGGTRAARWGPAAAQ